MHISLTKNVNGKTVPLFAKWALKGGWGTALPFLTLVLEWGGGGQWHAPATLPLETQKDEST